MAILIETFKTPIIQLAAKLANDELFCDEHLPKHRQQSSILFSNFGKKELAKCLLCSDLLFTIRQALAASETVKGQDFQKVSELVSFLAEILGILRVDFSKNQFVQEKRTSETLKAWFQDSFFFGFANAETKFLFRDIVIKISLERSWPEFFESYKNLVLGLYGSIISQFPEIKNIDIREAELETQLNKQFSKGFYNNFISTIVHSKIASKQDAKANLRILSIEPFQKISLVVSTLFETRSSTEEVVPCPDTTKILNGLKAKIVDHGKIHIPLGSIFDSNQFDMVIPETRRFSTCPKCNGTKQLICHECIGKKSLKCNECNGGKCKCVRCKGTGEEEYSDTFEKLLPCTCDRGVVAQKNGFAAAMNILTKDNPNIPYLKEVNVSKCNNCKGMGFIQKTMERIKSRPCAYCSTRGVIVCQFCQGSTKVPCSCCGATGAVDCDICQSVGTVEFRQVIHVKRESFISQTRFTSVPRECELKLDPEHFSLLATFKGNDVGEIILKHPFDRRFSDSFRKAISNYLLAESRPINEGQFIGHEVKIFMNCVYRIHYSMKGIQASSWWNPKIKTESISMKEYLAGILDLVKKNFKDKKSFDAAKKIALAENLARLNSSCSEDFDKFYKKLGLYQKFLVYVARHFVNPESIW